VQPRLNKVPAHGFRSARPHDDTHDSGCARGRHRLPRRLSSTLMLHQADTAARLRAISVAGVDPIIPVPNHAGVRVVRRVVRIAVVAQAQSDTCER
jgi:hypothetical protein